MQALENQVGGALLERTTTGIRPTDAGNALATSMQRVLADYDAAMAEARQLARGQRDLIRIGYLGSAAQTFLDPALFALRRTHPEVKVKLLDLSPGEQIVALRKGEIDLALIGQEGALLSAEFSGCSEGAAQRTLHQFAGGRSAGARPLDHSTLPASRVSSKIRRGSRQCFEHVYSDRNRGSSHVGAGLPEKFSCGRCSDGATLGPQSYLGLSSRLATRSNRQIFAGAVGAAGAAHDR
jgi:DNA-binding transcriptional LysR family regulator